MLRWLIANGEDHRLASAEHVTVSGGVVRPPALRPSDPPTLRPTDPPTLRPSDPPILRPSDPPTLRPSDPPTLRPFDPSTLRPSDLLRRSNSLAHPAPPPPCAPRCVLAGATAPGDGGPLWPSGYGPATPRAWGRPRDRLQNARRCERADRCHLGAPPRRRAAAAPARREPHRHRWPLEDRARRPLRESDGAGGGERGRNVGVSLQ